LLGFPRGELPQTYWTSRAGTNLHLEGTLFANDIALLGEAARRGLGSHARAAGQRCSIRAACPGRVEEA
jgi:hypothetical protein